VGAPLLYLGWRELDGERGVDQVALQADRLLVPGSVLAGVGVFGLGALFLYGSGARRVARWCAGGVLLVAAADIAENLDPLRGLTGAAGQPASEVATPLAVLKFAVGGPLLPVFVVAGGGYMTGAFQLALTPANPEAESLATAGDVFTPGSAEEDHLRRHGKYLADGGREWLTALGVVLRGVAASLGLLTLGVVVIGVGLNAFYRAAPVVDVTRFLPRFDPASGPEPAPFPAPPAAVWWTLGVGAAIAAAWVVVMVGLLASSDRLGLSRVARNLFRATVGVTAVVVVYAIAVPAVVWAMTRLTWATGVEPGAGRLLHRRRHHPGHLVRRPGRHDVAADREAAGQRGQAGAGRPAGPPGPGRGGRAAGRHRLGQRLIVWAVHAVLAFVFVFVGARTTAAAHRWPAWLGLVLLAVLVGAGFLIDQTWLGLHPFYRRRLASAFAVRRAHMPDGGTGALAYAIEEPNTLSA
jgi:hypothetical protein